jgi:hypothetical protein
VQLQKAINGKQKLGDLYKAQNYKTFERTGDIYCLFYEKGMNLLKPNGVLCYITSNKWMRAGYGEKLREFFTKYNPQVLIDLGPGVFESATVDTNILMLQNAPNQNRLKAATIHEAKKDGVNLSEFVENNSMVLNKLGKDAWFLGSSAEQKLKEKIERLGKPLKDWDVNIYRGVLTGLNEAFIITTEKRNEILANCQTKEERRRTEAIIKPVLRGRDIKRYYYEWAGLWVIVIPAGWTNENRGKQNAKEFIQEQFPSLITYLKAFEAKAKKRDDQGDYWWELRACAYYPEFEKEKVVYSETIKIYFDNSKNYPRFSYSASEFYLDKTTFFLSGNNQKYFLGFLNSNIGEFLLENGYCIKLGVGSRGLQKILIEKIPIPPITPSNESIVKQIEALVDKILAAKKQNPNANTNSIEKQIDEMVYKLYELTEEEIRIVEGG